MASRGTSAGFIAGITVAALLGGGAVAASFLPPGSVDTEQIRDQAVTNSRIANNAVGQKKLRDGAVTSKKIKDGTIQPVDFSWLVWSAIADAPGRQGPAGAPGATGATGAPGPSGAQGAVGPAGSCTAETILNGSGPPSQSTGTDGDFYIDTSAQVIYGPKSGSWPTPGTSIVGPKGATGDQGPTGPQGDPGATGATGPAGPQGDPGPTGATGATGDQGPKGDPGTSVLNGCVPPTDDLGNDGDFYLDTATSVLYGPKASGAWPATGTSLVGPAGPTGPQGATGPTGPAGGTFAPEYGQWSSTQTQGGTAFAGGAIIPLTFNVQDITPSSGISLDANGWNWRFASPGVWAGGFSAQIRKSGNGAAVVAIWWEGADPASGCDEASDFQSTPNSATRQRLSSQGEQSTMTVMFVFRVPEGGMCGRLVANAEGTATEPQEMEIIYEPALGSRPGAPSIIANVWRIG